ncbi:MAG: recombinase family protein [Prevotella sp.]|nr:recombinase family protein [Prevotella sp.]
MTKKTKQLKITKFSELENKVAALWTRVSTERQEENNCSLETQERICREYAEKHGITIKKQYGGTHESAKTEGLLYRKMIAEVAADREINIILVYSFDRFSRAGNEAIMTKAYLKSKGVYVISATQPIDTDSVAGEFMENILFLFNQFENSLRRDKAVTGMTACLQRGEWYGKAPLGYDHKKVGKTHILTINAAGRILKKAFLWKANEGMGDIEIVERLALEGLIVDRKHLNKILHNPFYCGKITHNLLGDEIVEGKQEKLIDEATFNKIQGITHAGYEHQEETELFPLKRHVRCSDCGGYLTGYTVKSRNKDYYKCNKKGCKSNHSTEKLHQMYCALLNTYSIPKPLIPILIKVLHKVFREYNQERSDTRTLLLKNKSEIEHKQEALKIRYGLNEIDKDVYDATSAYLNDQLTQIHKALQEAERDLSNEKKYIADVIAMSCKLGALWQKGDFRTRQKLQNLVYPNGILFDKHLGSYRTDNENEVFRIFRSISTGYIVKKEKATGGNPPLSPWVGMRRLERPTPTSRT